MQLKGKLALVTGASSGIGAATARHLARQGARLALTARREDALRRVADAIAADGGKASLFPADLAEPASVERMAEAVRAELGAPDIVVNNAGAGVWKPLAETSPAEARGMIEVPYLAAFYVTRAFLPEMLRRGSGRIAFVTSPASYMVWPGAAGYIAARHALKGLAMALRAELRGSGVGVTLVVLGTVSSPYWEHNPGSREHLPKSLPLVMPELTEDQAAETIARAIEHDHWRVFRPAIFRLLRLAGEAPS